MYLFNGLKEQLKGYLDTSQVQQIEQAYIFARDAHSGQLRSSGDPYITHPVAVAKILANLKLDSQTLMAALMHDVIEDCGVSREELAEKFGEPVAALVEGVSKLTQIKFNTREEAQAENFRKMMMAMVKDLRVVLIKLADRLHNMRTIGSLSREKKRRIAKETMDIYAPIAHRLGMSVIRLELEERGFAARYPMRHRVIQESVKKARGNRKEIVSSIIGAISERLQSVQINAEVSGREKTTYSIYRKMLRKVSQKAKFFNDIMDVYGFRVISDSEDDCYRILGQLHTLYYPVPGRFKDYIAIPKTNGYQSLHTTLKGPRGLHIEVQIRTTGMERMAENGVAAHWLYKSGSDVNQAEVRAREWMASLLELQKHSGDSMEFIESVKVDLFPDEVYIFTPNGKIIELMKGSTPVDFAYAIHTDVGNSCIAAKVNGSIVPLSTSLSNGQTVEIITAPGAKPNPIWLSFIKTSKARSNIRHFIKNLRRDDAINLGKRLLEKQLDGNSLEKIKPARISRTVKHMGFENFEDLLAEIGLGQIAALIVAHRLQSSKATDNALMAKQPDSIAIKGTEGMMIEYASCCFPIPGDPIVGTTNAKGGFILHYEGCKDVANYHKNPEKYVSVQWEKDIVGEFLVELRVEVINSKGVLAKIANIIAEEKINIVEVNNIDVDGTTDVLKFLLEIKNRLHLANLIRKIRLHDFVIKVSRLR